MKFNIVKLSIVLIATFLAFLNEVALAQSVTRLTFNQGTDFSASWDPRGVNIAYLRAQDNTQNIFDAYKVESSAQAGEQPLLTGISSPFGVATTTSWIGSTGFLVVEEAISGFEVLKFDTRLAPFNRTVTNGSDAGTTVLLSINGGGGGGISKISRDGLVALERVSTAGSAGTISIRSGAVSGMVGQVSSTFGTALISVVSGTPLYTNGGAINPDGSQFIIAAPSGSGYDLVLGSTTNAFPNINLTNDGSAGVMNVNPDISPDGQVVVFARSTPTSNGMFDLYTINIDGTNLTQLTNTPNFTENRPSWSPDGGVVAFDGAHLAGHESEFPALEAGEQTNSNVYRLTLPPANTVTPKTKLSDPPLVTIKNRNVIFTFTPFLNAQISAVVRSFETLMAAALKTKVSFIYELELTKKGAQQTQTKLTSKKNVLAAKNLKPGTYTARYRVQITSKSGSKPPVVKSTKFSPKATFQIGK